MIPHVNGYNADIDEEEISFAVENAKKVKWYDRVLLNRPLRVIVALIIVAILTPILVYRYVFFPSLELPPADGFSHGSCLVPRESRIPCGIEAVPPEQCHAQCCYDYLHNLCFHRYPSRFSYLFNGDWSEDVPLNPRIPTVPYASQRSLTNIRLSIDEVSASHLTLTFYNPENVLTGRRIEKKNYNYDVSEPELNVVVNATQGNIFNTARGPLIASDNIWELAFRLTNESMYGLGEIPLKADTVKVIYNHKGGLSSTPLIFAKLNDSYHGLLIEAKAPTEVIIRSDNSIVVRSITSWGLKFHLFVGPKPVDVMNDVMELIGVKKSLEYWMLGTHICGEITSENPLTELQNFINTANTQGLAFDSHCGVAPVVFDTECNSDLVSLVNQGATQIRNARKKFVPHVSPHIKYTEILNPSSSEEEIDIKTINTKSTERCFDDESFEQYIIRDPESNKLYKGKIDGHDVIYPSYEHVSEEYMKSLWVYNTDFDAVVLENNWPLDEAKREHGEVNDYLPYFNDNFEAAFNITPQWNATLPIFENTSESDNTTIVTSDTTTVGLDTTEPIQEAIIKSSVTEPTAVESTGEKYLYTHNEYGNQFSSAFEKIKGPIPTLSSSPWMNGNVFINRQNISTSWSSLHRELVEASLGGVSGHWYWSSPICGDTMDFNIDTHTRLCVKWYMAATYMPMVKIHSKKTRRDPLEFVGTHRTHMLTALNRRMSLLPYFYSSLQKGPLLRPMFFQYPSSDALKDLTTQFAVGNDLLIVPNLQPVQTHVHLWVPPGTWYELWSGLKIDAEEGEAVTMSTTEADLLTVVRGGSIIVMQKNVQQTAELTRLQSAYSLIIALECENTSSTEDFDQTSTTKIAMSTEDYHSTETNEVISTTEATGRANDDEEIKTTTETNKETATTCNAIGKLHMTANMAIIFEANEETLKITADGADFHIFCDINVALWSRSVTDINIYGLDKDKNNYDYHRHVSATIDLCQLLIDGEIIFELVD